MQASGVWMKGFDIDGFLGHRLEVGQEVLLTVSEQEDKPRILKNCG